MDSNQINKAIDLLEKSLTQENPKDWIGTALSLLKRWAPLTKAEELAMEREFLTADRAVVTRMLAGIPEDQVIDRGSMQYRLQQIDSRLAELTDEQLYVEAMESIPQESLDRADTALATADLFSDHALEEEADSLTGGCGLENKTSYESGYYFGWQAGAKHVLEIINKLER
jgi:hypothetical protein